MPAADGGGQCVDDPAKLSVGELKKRIFWAGGVVPSGLLEKSDLVAALKTALVDKAERPKEPKTQVPPKQEPEPPKREAWRDAKEIDYDSATAKVSNEQKEVVDFMVLSEEDLKKRIKAAGGNVPDGDCGKFFLVSALKLTLKEEAELKRKQEEEERNRPAPPTYAPPPGSLGVVVEWFDNSDPAKLSAAELKMRLRAYGDPFLVRGLTEKAEFIEALRTAVKQRGPAPKRRGVAAPQPVAQNLGEIGIHEDEMMRQMEEMQANLDADEARQAAVAASASDDADAGAYTPTADATADATANAAAAPAAVAPVPHVETSASDARARRKDRIAAAAAKAAASAPPAGAKVNVESAASRAAKRRRLRGKEVLLSDSEGETCAVVASAVTLDEFDDEYAVAVADGTTSDAGMSTQGKQASAKPKSSSEATPRAGIDPVGAAVDGVGGEAIAVAGSVGASGGFTFV